MSKDVKNVPALRFKGTLTLGKSVSWERLQEYSTELIKRQIINQVELCF